MRDIAEAVELANIHAELNVLPEEYVRLLGYPRGWVLEGRARELADWARDWYAKNGRPWFYARQAESFEIDGDSIQIDGVQFTSKRMQSTLQQAEAHSVFWLRLARDGKPRKKLAGAGKMKSRTSIFSSKYLARRSSSIWPLPPERVCATGRNSMVWPYYPTIALGIQNGMSRTNRGCSS